MTTYPNVEPGRCTQTIDWLSTKTQQRRIKFTALSSTQRTIMLALRQQPKRWSHLLSDTGIPTAKLKTTVAHLESRQLIAKTVIGYILTVYGLDLLIAEELA